MINIYKNRSYMKLISPILDHKEFNQIETIEHHGTNRLNHCLRVSYYSYQITKLCHLNSDEVARAGLLHDFYLNRTVDFEKTKDKILLFTTQHPTTAIENAKKYFELSNLEENIIRSHMFPLDFHIPKYAESWIVNLVDKAVSAYEFGRKFRYQLSYGFNISILFMLNILK